MSEIILFKYTSRSRPDKFFTGLDSIVNNLANKEDYYVQCTFDLSDDTMCDPEVVTRLNTYKNLSYYFGESKNKIDAINKNLDKLPYFHILVNMSDDQQFLVNGFDNIIRNDMKESCSDLDMFLHYPDSHAGSRLPTMSIMGVTYFKRSGVIYRPEFSNVYCDNFAFDEAKYLNKYKFINKTIFDHFHPAWGMAEMDEQYKKTEAPEGYELDRQTYLKLKKELI